MVGLPTQEATLTILYGPVSYWFCTYKRVDKERRDLKRKGNISFIHGTFLSGIACDSN
jgi:hypothetical protein